MSEMIANLNDVNLGKLNELVTEYRADPDAARSIWSARVQWLGGLRNEAQVREFTPFRADEPTWLAGTDTDPTPSNTYSAPLASA